MVVNYGAITLPMRVAQIPLPKFCYDGVGMNYRKLQYCTNFGRKILTLLIYLLYVPLTKNNISASVLNFQQKTPPNSSCRVVFWLCEPLMCASGFVLDSTYPIICLASFFGLG
ncbi:hypothetical protein VIGAN_08144500 [Vigna angularis var. angularis]|uniref:Uncharacterized protein n=1 Tax=Vigna angularis var. angularis TaxID=157739 RepID=A0A0S3SPP2_PHAAN|nr:hypothetical protein VIGAN_08144500 [Vigna angularis var. angularis]